MHVLRAAAAGLSGPRASWIAIFRPYVQLTKLPRASLLPCAGETCIAQVWRTREGRNISLRTGR